MYPRRPCSTALGPNQWFSFTSLKNFLRFFVSNLISLTRCLYRYMQVNVMEVNASQRKNTLYSFQSSALFIGGHCSLSVLNTRARCHNSNGLSCDISFFLLIIRRSPFKSWSATFAGGFFLNKNTSYSVLMSASSLFPHDSQQGSSKRSNDVLTLCTLLSTDDDDVFIIFTLQFTGDDIFPVLILLFIIMVFLQYLQYFL